MGFLKLAHYRIFVYIAHNLIECLPESLLLFGRSTELNRPKITLAELLASPNRHWGVAPFHHLPLLGQKFDITHGAAAGHGGTEFLFSAPTLDGAHGDAEIGRQVLDG
jgi:hypothetical protein